MRFEIKFTAPASEQPRIEGWMRTHPALFYQPYPDRRINSVYFDSYALHTCQESLSGLSSRSKIRYRWYGARLYPDTGALEIKRRRNGQGWKIRYPVSDAPGQEGATWRQIYRYLCERLPPEGLMALREHPCPVLLIRYTRRYLVSRDHRIRVTIDRAMTVYDQRYGATPNITRRVSMPDLLIMEFKCDETCRSDLSEAVQTFPARAGRFSKYCAGVQAIYGY